MRDFLTAGYLMHKVIHKISHGIIKSLSIGIAHLIYHIE